MAEVKRFEFIDLFKAIGIIFMVMGHINYLPSIDFGDKFADYISAFHMPMFFFISGYLFKNYEFKELLKRKYNSLIKPYLYFGFLNALLCILLVHGFKIGTYFEKLFFFNNRHLQVAGALWFLTCLFFVNIIFWYLNSKIKNKYLLGFVLLIIAVAEYYLKIRLPYSIDAALFMLLVFYAGYVFKKKEPNLNLKQELAVGVSLFVISFIFIFKNGHCNVRAYEYPNLLLFYFNALTATLAYFYLSKLICNFVSLKPLQYIGKNSLNYLALNQIVITVTPVFGGGAFLCLIIDLIIMTVLSEIVNNVKKFYPLICEYFRGVRNLTK